MARQPSAHLCNLCSRALALKAAMTAAYEEIGAALGQMGRKVRRGEEATRQSDEIESPRRPIRGISHASYEGAALVEIDLPRGGGSQKTRVRNLDS